MYFAPTSVEDALDILAKGACVVAGGTDFFPSLGQAIPGTDILDISRIPGLRGIRRTGEGWWIGATTTWSDIASSDLPAPFRALQKAAREVGGRQIQNAATIGGNLCNASPAADGVPPLLVLDAEVELVSARSRRRLSLSDFLQGARETAIRPGELMTGVWLPEPKDLVSTFEKLGARRYLVISIVMVAVALRIQNGLFRDVRISVGACSAVARRLTELEERLDGLQVPHSTEKMLVDISDLSPLSPIGDVRAGADYRMAAAAELVGRALVGAAHEGAIHV